MATINKVTRDNFTPSTKGETPFPVYSIEYNKAVDQINTTTTLLDSTVAQTTALNSAISGTTNITNTQKVLVSLTSANLLGMNAAPVTVIAAPGAGKAIRVKSCVVAFDSTGTAYANGGVIYLSYSNTTPITNNAAATLLTTAQDKVYQLNALAAAGGINTLVNTAVTITNDTAPFITGTGVAKLLIEYDVVTTGF